VKISDVVGAASLYSVPHELIDPRDPGKVNKSKKQITKGMEGLMLKYVYSDIHAINRRQI
jgi:hypothetical protein